MIIISELKTVSVSQINAYIKKIVDSNTALTNFWIRGEISNFKRHYSGHLYITLKDENSVLKAVMFKGFAGSLNFEPKDGIKVIARGRIGVYEANGTYQMYIEEMHDAGAGDLKAKYEKLKLKLEEQGLFDDKFKQKIPRIPERIGVCTATTGAAVHDIINVISRRFPAAEIVVYPTIVQGEQSAQSIVNAIDWFNKNNGADVLIVGRGGGSIEDLWSFNEEVVAYAIFNSKIPIISAVGHETDFTIADYVADMRAPTPSAAAELCVPSSDDIIQQIKFYENNIIKVLKDRIEFLRLKTDKTLPQSPKEYIVYQKTNLENLSEKLDNGIISIIREYDSDFQTLLASLNNLSPLAVMARGYTLTLDESGKIIRSAKSLKSGTQFVLKFYDGKHKCTVD